MNIITISPLRRARAHNAAFLDAKVNRSDPFAYARTFTEQSHDCDCRGGVNDVVARSTTILEARK